MLLSAAAYRKLERAITIRKQLTGNTAEMTGAPTTMSSRP
jgi:hypothetical protein